MIVNVRVTPPVETEIEIDGFDGRWMTDEDGFAFPALPVAENTKAGDYSLTVKCPQYGVSASVKFTVTLPPGLRVDIMPAEVTPGEIFMVNVVLQPPAAVYFTIRGIEGRWMTDAEGFGTATLRAGTTPGDYQIIVDVPSLDLSGSELYTITAAPQIGTAYNIVASDLAISIDASSDEGEFEAGILLGGQYIRGSVENNEVHASGRVPTNSAPGTIYYDFTLSSDLSRISGTVRLYADDGESYTFTFSNLPRDSDIEEDLKQQGAAALVFGVSGTAVSNHLGSVSVNMPNLGSISRYFTQDGSELYVVLRYVDESQIADYVDE
jgi:hypothetical protein